ncbi:MAG: hypothetical protein RLP09_10945 [Sandaracinaceae bacterium]
MIRTLLVACLLALLASTRASAQAPSAAEEFQRGLEAFEQDRIEAALAHFRSALELDPRDAVRFNIALCLEQLGQHREAAEEYERAASSDEVPEEARRLAAAQAEVNRARLAELRATGWPGARLSVDGRARCTLPCATREDPGAHEIAATLDGRTWSDSVQLRAGERVILSVVEPPARVVAAPAEPVVESGWTPAIGWLGGLGISLGLAGTGATIGLGWHAERLHAQYVLAPSLDGAREGSAFRDATNVSLSIAIAGAALFLVDLIVGTGR